MNLNSLNIGNISKYDNSFNFVKSFKGQSAIEYLMTYGWMLLVVAVVGGAIFSITADQTVETVNGFTGSDVQVDDFGVNSDGGLDLVLRNSASQSVTVNSVNLTDDEDYTEFVGGEEISVGDTGVVGLANVSDSDGSNDLDVEIDYDVGGLTGLQVSGSITGGLEITGSGSSTGDAFEGPSASMTVNNSNPDVGEDVEFDASSSSEGDSGIESYTWDFDDESTATGETVDHSFDASDSYSVELEVEDENGETDTASETVDVEEATVSSSGAPSFDTSTGDEDSWVPVSADSETENGFDYFFDETGDSEYFSEEEGFYVMKYEAKAYDTSTGSFVSDGCDGCSTDDWADESVEPRSVAANKPWRDISFNENDPDNGYGAVQACEALDSQTSEYDVHLTTNREWMTVARQIEQTDSNWVGGTVDSNGQLIRGNSDGSDPYSASTDDSQGFYNLATGEDSDYNERTFDLANGEVVWDWAGNVRQWVYSEDSGGSTTNGVFDSAVATDGSDDPVAKEYEYDPAVVDRSTNGVGSEYDFGSGQAALRGGFWHSGDDAGVFYAYSSIPDYSSTSTGFRCSAVPVS